MWDRLRRPNGRERSEPAARDVDGRANVGLAEPNELTPPLSARDGLNFDKENAERATSNVQWRMG